MSTPIELTTLQLLGRGPIHTWLHADAHGVAVGRLTEAGEYQLITSERQALDAKTAGAVLSVQPRTYPHFIGRWPDSDVDDWLTTGQSPTFSEVLALAMRAFDSHLELPRREHRALLATWAVGTYFFPLFLSYPRLSFSGERGCGKSKALTLLAAMAWHGCLALIPTAAVLFRFIEQYRSTLLLDEVEGFNNEDSSAILAIINSGYKADGVVLRVEGKDERRIVPFAAFAPLALAAIKGPNATTEDRCIPLVMQRGADRARINSEPDARAEAFRIIRSGCYRLLLTRWSDVMAGYGATPLPEWLNGRTRELWHPLLALAAVADAESDSLALTEDLLALARDHIADRDDVSVEAEALLAELAERLRDQPSVVIHPGDLREPLRIRLGWREAPTPHVIGSWLRRLGFHSQSKRDRNGARYLVTTEQLHEVTNRYTPERNVTSSSSYPNGPVSLSGDDVAIPPGGSRRGDAESSGGE